MRWNRSARLLAVASMTLACAAWGQVQIQNNGTSTPTNGLGLAIGAVPALPVVNGGAGVNKSTEVVGTPIAPTTQPTDLLPTTIPLGQGIIGGPGGPSGDRKSVV